jgi:symplekin
LRGLTLLGGQVKIDVNLLSDMMMGRNNSPSAQVVSILKPAALAYLEVESNLPHGDANNALEIQIDRGNMEFEFSLSQKSYALTINAVAALSSNRPVFFKEGALCLARRNVDPPVFSEEGHLSKSAVLAIQSHVKASCLTLLRNALSVQTQSSQILLKTLEQSDMKFQGEKALKMATQTNALKTAGRAARNRANMFYEWESTDQRTSKRQRETDDALAKMRAAKAARGLGHGIQLPTSMVDSIELIMANLKHLPTKRPPVSSSSKRKSPASLDFVVDAVMTNGASLAQEEGRWYSRDGGTAWSRNLDGEANFELSDKLLRTIADDETDTKRSKQVATTIRDQKKMYYSQCNTAASEAVGRIVTSSLNCRDAPFSEFANKIAAKLAWTLKGVPASSHLKPAQDMALDTIQSSKRRIVEKEKHELMDKLASIFPLVASCLALEATSSITHGVEEGTTKTSSLSDSVLNEAYIQSCSSNSGETESSWKYDSSLDIFTGSILHSSERANDKPADNDRKRVATNLASSMQTDLAVLPALTSSSMTLVGAMCDIDGITKKAAEADRKQSQQTIAASAALHAARQAAEKRATAALLTLRDTAFQRSNVKSRKSAVQTAVAIASGNLSASKSCEDKALKLVMNVLFAKSESIANYVVDAAIKELKQASDYAVENHSSIQIANETAAQGKESTPSHQKNGLAPNSEEERLAMEKVRKPIVLFMALCIRRPEIIKTLFALSSVPKADVLSKTVLQSMSKLARAAGTKHGAAPLALKVAEVTVQEEIPLFLAFLENLAPVGDKNVPPQDLIDACFQIQESKAENGKKDPRFLIPVACVMKRDELVEKLPDFVKADNKILMSALVKMGERLGRHALLFRNEPEPETPQLKGITLCEQLVFLHKLDFSSAGLPQKRYLDVIRLCLDNDEIFNDRLIMSALDHMSGTFLTGAEKLPLAYMRTIILVCSKHESLHSWICHTLLPRLIEGKIYTDRRQWEGWMRCAKMLENNADSGVSSAEAINKLPPEQFDLYRARYGS